MTEHKIRWRVLGILGLSLLTLGCTLLSLRSIPTSTPTVAEPSATLWPTETSRPTVTPTPAPSATPTPNPCPPQQDIAFPARPNVHFLESYLDVLQAYLAEGGDPVKLATGLAEWDVLPPERNAGPLIGDLTGNGVSETVVAFINAKSETFPPQGALAVFGCRDNTVRTVTSHTLGTGNYLWLIDIADLTEDGVADLSFTDVTCGAHTCWYTAHVWSWMDAQFTEQIEGSFSLPYAFFWVEDGQLHGRSGGIGSVGAGPQRTYTETWQWNGEVITLATEEVGPARYRYHAFLDGDQALFAEDYDAAFDAYLRVINDKELDPWAGMYQADEERQWLTALAQWRLLILDMKLGNFPDAEARYERLQTEYPPDTPGHAVARLAEHFWTRHRETGNVAYGCLEVIDRLETERVLTFLNSFGYANPLYTPKDLCPFLDP